MSDIVINRKIKRKSIVSIIILLGYYPVMLTYVFLTIDDYYDKEINDMFYATRYVYEIFMSIYSKMVIIVPLYTCLFICGCLLDKKKIQKKYLFISLFVLIIVLMCPLFRDIPFVIRKYNIVEYIVLIFINVTLLAFEIYKIDKPEKTKM